MEHRFAFSAWIKNKTQSQQKDKIKDEDFVPPDLLTFDWHDDIGGKCDFIERDLIRLNQNIVWLVYVLLTMVILLLQCG